VRALDRKLVRDLWHLRGQAIAIALVIACGVAVFVSSVGNYHSLLDARARYYAATRFADVFASLKRAPNALAERLAELPGIAQVETRIVQPVTIDLPDGDLPVTGRMISLPARGAPALNRLYLRHGQMPAAGMRDEIVISEAFAAANRLRPGDRIAAILNGRTQPLRIAGIVLSAEYVFASRPGEAIPDDAHFGILWMERPAMEAAFDMEGAFNDVTARLGPSSSEGGGQPSVLAGLDRLLEPYGGLVAHGRDLQPSHRFVDEEIHQQGIMASTMPVLFLSVAAFLVHVVLGRVIQTQREQIAALKALGFSGREIGLHYLKFAILVVMAGVLPGVLFGIWFGRMMTDNYTVFFRFPDLHFVLRPWVPVLASAIAIVAGLAGTMGAVRSVLRLAPAEAMRPPAPFQYRHGWLDRSGLLRAVRTRHWMSLRGITARPLRALFTIAGMAFSVPIIVVSLFWTDAIDYMIYAQFRLAERGHLSVTFNQPVPMRAAREIGRMPGVLTVEPARHVPVRLRAGHRSYRTAIAGLPAPNRLRRLLDEALRPITLPADGLALSRRLAERLDVRQGDEVRLEILEGERPVRQVRLAAVVDDLVGLSAYMNIDALTRLMREGDSINAVSVLTDGARTGGLYARLKAAPMVQTVSVKGAALRQFQETTVKFILIITTIFTAFSAVIAIGMVYSTARIALQERAWELASLRVLGFTRGEVAWMLLGGIGLQVVAAIPIGLWLGYWWARGLIALNTMDLFRIPLVISVRSYTMAALFVLAAAAVSAWIVRRRIDHLDLIGVLKTRE